MLFLCEKGDFAFVKVAQNSLLSGMSASGLGALSCLSLAKTNPKHEFTMKYIRSVLHPYTHSDAALSELERFGYLTKHCYPTDIKNIFRWSVECDSFHQNTDPYGIIYHSAKGDAKTGANLRRVRPVPFCARFLRVPKELILNTSLSLSAKGLYMHLLFFSRQGKELTQEEIKSKANLSAYEFRKALKELKDSGFLTSEKTKERKYQFVLHFLPVENTPDATSGNKRTFYKISTLRSEKVAEQKTAKDAKASSGFHRFMQHSYDFDAMEFMLWLKDLDEKDITLYRMKYKERWEEVAKEEYLKERERRRNKPKYDFAVLNAMIAI